VITQFLHHLQHYAVEVVPALAIGFFLSGIAHEFIPQGWVDKNLGNKGFRAILLSTLVGTMLPICCFGSLPVAVGFYKKGAKLGPVLAFLVATPATSISALLVTYRLLGIEFTVFIFFAVILMGVVMGIIGNRLSYIRKIQKEDDTCPHCHEEKNICEHRKNISSRIKSVLKFAYVEMPKEIGLETWAFFMIGLPGEDVNTFKETICFAKKISPDVAKFHILKPYPGSEVYDYLRSKGLILTENYDSFGIHTPPIHKLETMSPDEMSACRAKAYADFYLNPKGICKRILQRKRCYRAWNFWYF